MQAGRPAQRIGMPRVVAARREHPRDVRCSAHTDAGTHVSEVPRILQQHYRRRAAVPEHGHRVDLGPQRERDHPRGGGERRQPLEHGGVDGSCERTDARPQVRSKPCRQALELLGVVGVDLEHRRAEAQGVLQGVKTLEHGEPRVAPRAAEVGNQ